MARAWILTAVTGVLKQDFFQLSVNNSHDLFLSQFHFRVYRMCERGGQTTKVIDCIGNQSSNKMLIKAILRKDSNHHEEKLKYVNPTFLSQKENILSRRSCSVRRILIHLCRSKYLHLAIFYMDFMKVYSSQIIKKIFGFYSSVFKRCKISN